MKKSKISFLIPSSLRTNFGQKFFDDYHKLTEALIPYQRPPGGELGENFRELGENFRELGEKCCQGNFSQAVADQEHWKKYNDYSEEIIQLLNYLQENEIHHQKHTWAKEYFRKEIEKSWCQIILGNERERERERTISQFFQREMDLALARETGRKIIFTLFEFHEKIGKLSPNDRKKIEKQITPSFDRNSQVDYPTHIGDLKEKQLEEYLKLVIRKIRGRADSEIYLTGWTGLNQSDAVQSFLISEATHEWDSIWVNILPELVGVKNQFQTEIAATTCLPEVVHVFLSKKDLLAKREKQLLDTRKKELTNARKNAWSWINRDLEQVREAGLNLAISWNQKSLDRAQEISKIEEQVDEIHKIIFHQVLSGIEENLLLLREVLGEPQFKSWSSQTKAARSLTELLQVYKNFASGRENYLSYKKILLDTLKRAKQANQQTSRSELESLLWELNNQQKKCAEEKNDPNISFLPQELGLGLVLKFIKDLLIEKLLTESQKTIDEKIKNSEIVISEREINHYLTLDDWKKTITEASCEELLDGTNQRKIISAPDELSALKKTMIAGYAAQKWEENPNWIGLPAFGYDPSEEIQYLDYCNIPEEPKVEEFLADRDTTFGQINQLLEEIKGIDNITPWTKLQQLKNKFDSYLYGERAEERDKFSSRVLSGENNSPYVVNWQYKLENQIQLYQQKERDLIAVLNSELARACCNPQTCADWAKKLDAYASYEWANEKNQRAWQEARHEVNQYLTAFRDLKKMLQGAASAVKSKNRVWDKERWMDKLTVWQESSNPYWINARENEQNSHRIRKTLARIKLKKLLEKGNFNEVSQSADEIRKLMAELNKREFVNEEEKAVWADSQSEIDGSLLLLGTLLVFHDELDELLTKDSEDPDQLRKIIVDLEQWKTSSSFFSGRTAEILISKITTRIDEIKAKIAAKEQVQREEEINQKKTYWQNQLNNLLNKQKEVISDPSQIKLLQQSLILKQFTDDENGVIQKEIWSSHENQSLIQNACRELQNYYDVFSELNQILAREGNDYEELENLKKELNSWLNSPIVAKKNAAASWKSRLADKNSEIENQIERLQKTAVEPDQSFEEKLIINPIPKVQSVAVIKEIVNEGTEVCQGPAPKTIVKVEKEIAIVEQMPWWGYLIIALLSFLLVLQTMLLFWKKKIATTLAGTKKSVKKSSQPS